MLRDAYVENAKEFVLSSLVSNQIVDGKGRLLGRVGPVDEDLDGHVVMEVCRELQSVGYFFLRKTFERIKASRTFDAETLTEHLFQSPAFLPERRKLIRIGIEHYFDENYVESIHVLIPQFEAVARNVVEESGGQMFERGRHGSLNLLTMDKLMKTPEFLETFDEDTVRYLRILYTDPRGWNLRNNMCHALDEVEKFNVMAADRVIHSFLLFRMLEAKGHEQ